MKGQTSILVPVDFSSNSIIAYQYAQQLATYMNAAIKLVHIDSEVMMSSNPISMVTYPDVKAELRKKLSAFCDEHRIDTDKGNVKTMVISDVLEGITVSGEIVQQSKFHDLIVIGCKGENMNAKKIFGSVPSQVAQKAKIPVLVIPIDAEFIAPSKLLFSSNWESVRDDVLSEFLEWTKVFNAQVHFLHISPSFDDYEAVKEGIFNFLEEEPEITFSYQISEEKNNSPLKGIIEYADKQDVDWIVLGNRQKGLINNILRNSLTKEMTINPRVPVFVLNARN